MLKLSRNIYQSGFRGATTSFQLGTVFARRRKNYSGSSGFSPLTPMSLEEVMKLDMITNESPERLRTIWTEYHLTKATSLGFVIGDEENTKITERVKESPIFIHPVFKDENGSTHIIMLSQMLEKCTIFTYLEEYKLNPEAATQWASLKVFDDFVSSKGLALVRGDISPQLTRAEGDQLIRSMLHVYTDDDVYSKYVKVFNHSPNHFHFEEYINFMKSLINP